MTPTRRCAFCDAPVEPHAQTPEWDNENSMDLCSDCYDALYHAEGGRDDMAVDEEQRVENYNDRLADGFNMLRGGEV